MKRLFFSAFIFFSTIYSLFPQSISNLDNLGGFKKILLGDNYSEWEKYLTPSNEKSNMISGKAYNLSHTCCEYLYEFKIHSIDVDIVDDVIRAISIHLKPCGTNESSSNQITWKECYEIFYDLEERFTKFYGRMTSRNLNSEDGDIFDTWAGKSIALCLNIISQDNGQKEIIINYVDWIYIQKNGWY